MSIKKRLLGVAALTALIGAAFGQTAPANAQTGGVLAFECSAHLPAFPSPTGDQGNCNNGLLNVPIPSIAVGVGADLGSGQVIAPSAGAVGGFQADFGYDEPCQPTPTGGFGPPLEGFADGTASVPVTLIPSLSADRLNVHFNWTRVGIVAVVTVDRLWLDSQGDPGSPNATGAAVAAFAPILGLGNLACPGAPAQALAIGAGAGAAL